MRYFVGDHIIIVLIYIYMLDGVAQKEEAGADRRWGYSYDHTFTLTVNESNIWSKFDVKFHKNYNILLNHSYYFSD